MTERPKPPAKRPLGPVELEDRCPMCDAKLRPHDRAWLMMDTTEGLVAAANYCANGECEPDAQAVPEEVARLLRRRKAWMENPRV